MANQENCQPCETDALPLFPRVMHVKLPASDAIHILNQIEAVLIQSI